MKSLENVFEETFFLNQARDDVLDLAGFDPVEPRYKFFKESRLHRGIVGKCGRDGDLKFLGRDAYPYASISGGCFRHGVGDRAFFLNGGKEEEGGHGE